MDTQETQIQWSKDSFMRKPTNNNPRDLFMYLIMSLK